MWFITHVASGESICFLPEKLRYSVGRIGADVELQDDICVSRAHAAFNLIKVNDNFNLEIEDLGSKYGTFLNKDIESNTPLEKGHKITLKNNDLIRFGRLQNVWKVEFMVIETVASSLTRDENLQLRTYIEALGGKISEQWSSNCTHLTMGEPSVTIKLLHALIEQKFIVTPAYWKELLKSVKSIRSHLPKSELFRPDFGDEQIDFNFNIKRKSLFKDVTFIFLNRKHFDLYEPIVKLAGGACKDINSGVQKAFLIKDKVVVVQYTPSTQTQSSQTISTIAEFLESNSKRIIPEYEIGLAILHCSIEKFCNPCFKMTQTMPMSVPNEAMQSSIQIDLTDDQSTQSLNTKKVNLEIPETNKNIVTSTPYVEPENLNKHSNEDPMPEIHIAETPVENERKRKLSKDINVGLDESDDDLFQFQSKKACNNKIDGNNTFGIEVGKSSIMSVEKENIMVAEKFPNTKTSKNNMFSNFLQKTQSKDKIQVAHHQSEEEPSTSKETRKRPLVQVLNEDDEGDEDLFSFGDTQKIKKSRKQSNDEEDFNFKEREPTKTNKPIGLDEDSNDIEPTQQFIVPETVNKKSIQMPKPKILPRKISAIEWISNSLGKISIKKETASASNKDENDTTKAEADIKTEIIDDLNITDDHRKWVESIKNAIEIQQVSLNISIKYGNKSHYKFKSRTNNKSENLNETAPNFKKFIKRYQNSCQRNSNVIKLHLR